MKTKKWVGRLRKIKLKRGEVISLILMVSWILTVGFLVFYFNNLIEKQKQYLTTIPGSAVPLSIGTTNPEILWKLKESAVERYFLSEVKMINSYYTPTVQMCLFADGKPIFPSYVYETWSNANYPEDKPPQIALVRYLLLPEDNSSFRLNKSCFIKEIKTEKDWQDLNEKYGFSRSQFSNK